MAKPLLHYKSGYKYQTTETIILQTRIIPDEPIISKWLYLDLFGKLTIMEGYAWDGASGPTWDTDNSIIPSLYHDAMAQLLRQELINQEWLPFVNAEFDDMLKERGMSWLRRRIWRRGLWLTGGSFANPKNIRIIHKVN